MKNRIPRKLKKKYKKMGIWSSYLQAREEYDRFNNPPLFSYFPTL